MDFPHLHLLLFCAMSFIAIAKMEDNSVMICRKEWPDFCDSKLPNLGKPGKRGPAGEKGEKGEPGPKAKNLENSYGKSCQAIRASQPNAPNGLYTIKDDEGSVYTTYCDMAVAGGGWTLVASVHENFLAGKCTLGDKWSSEHGNNEAHPHGDGNWANMAIFGAPESATSDDYKNQGYFNLKAKNVMIWHVPNDTPLRDYYNRAFMIYYTSSNILTSYGGNLQQLFGKHYLLRHGLYTTKQHGPSAKVNWARGSDGIMWSNVAPNLRREVEVGYIQFRAINNEGSALAVCPGLRMKPGFGNSEHGCIGGTSNHKESPRHCGDFGSKDWDGYAANKGWASNRQMTESVVMIFYR